MPVGLNACWIIRADRVNVRCRCGEGYGLGTCRSNGTQASWLALFLGKCSKSLHSVMSLSACLMTTETASIRSFLDPDL